MSKMLPLALLLLTSCSNNNELTDEAHKAMIDVKRFEGYCKVGISFEFKGETYYCERFKEAIN